MNGPRPPIPNLDKILKASEDRDKELWDYFFKNVLDRSPARPHVWHESAREKSTAEDFCEKIFANHWLERGQKYPPYWNNEDRRFCDDHDSMLIKDKGITTSHYDDSECSK